MYIHTQVHTHTLKEYILHHLHSLATHFKQLNDLWESKSQTPCSIHICIKYINDSSFICFLFLIFYFRNLPHSLLLILSSVAKLLYTEMLTVALMILSTSSFSIFLFLCLCLLTWIISSCSEFWSHTDQDSNFGSRIYQICTPNYWCNLSKPRAFFKTW